MALLLGTQKLGPTTRLGIPLGVFFLQINPTEQIPPDFKDHLRVIQRPLHIGVFPYIASYLVARDDIRGGDSISVLKDRYREMLNSALQLRDQFAGEPYDIRVSVGYIAKLFPSGTLSEVPEFVNAICDVPGVDGVVVSWHVIDEPIGKGSATPVYVHDVVDAFHGAQVARGKNWPFIYIEAADGRYDWSDPNHPNAQGWWPPTPDGKDRYYNPANFTKDGKNDAQRIHEFVHAIASVVSSGVPARPILMLDYYSFFSGNWRYTVLPPMRKWKFIQEWWADQFPNYPIHALMEGAAQVTSQGPNYVKTMLQGHVDMHNQMRMALKYGFNGIGLWGWSSSNTTAPDLYYTKHHWTYDTAHTPQLYFSVSDQLERWGEAVGNEVWREQEFYTEAIPSAGGIVAAIADPDTDPPPNQDPLPGYWIQFDLAQRARVHFVIRDSGGSTTRILDWGYKNNTSKPGPGFTYLDLYGLAAGRYRNLVRPSSGTFPLSVCRPTVDGVSGDMNGTAIWWDLRDENNVPVSSGSYFAQMYAEGVAVGASVSLTVPLP